MTTAQLLAIIEKYLEIFPEEKLELKVLLAQLEAGERLNDRRNFRGHVTASGIVLSPDKSKVLLIHHNFFKLWQQPGGHWEVGEPNPWQAARREVEEETGVKLARQIIWFKKDKTIPLDIDSHRVPARPYKNEPAHQHHDLRYVFSAAQRNTNYQAKEVGGARWYKLDDPMTERVARPLAKLRRLGLAK